MQTPYGALCTQQWHMVTSEVGNAIGMPIH